MISSTRLRNSGRKWLRSSSRTRCSTRSQPAGSSCAPASTMYWLPMFEVMMITELRKSTTLPWLSVSRPSSRIWSSTLKTSGCAFSISSNRMTLYGRRRIASVSWPPSSYPTYPGGAPIIRATEWFSMYSDISSRTSARSSSNRNSARARAEFLFDDERALVRLDMSEYMENHSVARMIGAPPGYVGYEEGGQLTEAIRRRPYSVILFDEIEKAHPDVFNVLLQILDDGRLTDSQGRVVDFRNTVIIMTSNVGSQLIVDAGAQPTEAAWERLEQRVRDELRNYFRPESLNGVDDVIVFHQLGRHPFLAM